MGKYRVWSDEQKRAAVEEMKTSSPGQIAAKWGIARRQLYAWRKYVAGKDAGPEKMGTEQQLRKQIEQLERALGRKAAEADFLQGVLRRLEARGLSSRDGETASTRKSK